MGVTAIAYDATTEDEVVEAVRDGRSDGVRLTVRGTGSLQDRIGGPADGTRVLSVAGLAGLVDHNPEDLVVTVRAGTPLDDLRDALSAAGQECPIEMSPAALDGAGERGTVGGRLASALAGPRQLDAGRVRDWVLRVRFVAGDASVITYGGVTVKDVTGYDLSRLIVGSWGGLGVLTEVTLKVRPIARSRRWVVADATEPGPIERVHRPAGVLSDGSRTWIRLEGHPEDVEEDVRTLAATGSDAPTLPDRARVSVDPPDLADVAAAAREAGCRVLTQDGVGVAHLDGDGASLAATRTVVEGAGGSMLVLDPTLGVDAFGGARRLSGMAARVADAIDPDRVFSGRWAR